MRRSNGVVLVLGLSILPAFVSAAEPGIAEGSVTAGGESIPLRFAYGRVDDGNAITIALTSDPVPAGATLAALPRHAASVEIVFDGSRRMQRIAVRHPAFRGARTVGAGAVDFQPSLVSRRLVDAVIATRSTDLSFQAAFRAAVGEGRFAANAAAEAFAAQAASAPAPPRAELPVPPPVAPSAAPKGTPLPKDGGDPWKAYLRFDAALRRADVAAVKAMMAPAAIAAFDQSATMFSQGPEVMLAFAAGIGPIELRFLRGSIHGNRADIEATGTPACPECSSRGKIVMVRDKGTWKMENHEWTVAENGPAVTIFPPDEPLTRGTPLPAGGGEAGEVWRRYDRALRDMDVPSIKTLFVEEVARYAEWFPLGFLRVFRWDTVEVTGGYLAGDMATLKLAGKGNRRNINDMPPAGTAILRKEKGQWKLVKEIWTR